MNLLRRLYLSVAYFFAISLFLLISISFNLISWLTLKTPWVWGDEIRYRNLLQSYFIFWARFMRLLGVLKLTTPAKTAPKKDDGQLWLCNHPTILDGSYLLKFVTDGFCIYKNTIRKNPCYGSVVKLARYLPNVGGPDIVRSAAEKLSNGQDLVVFPEGTRSTHLNTALFKPGFALIAKRAEAKINLLWIEGPDDFLTREAPLMKVPRLPARVDIHHFDTIECSRHSSVRGICNEVIAAYEREASKPKQFDD